RFRRRTGGRRSAARQPPISPPHRRLNAAAASRVRSVLMESKPALSILVLPCFPSRQVIPPDLKTLYRACPQVTEPLPILRTVQVGRPSTTVRPIPRAVIVADFSARRTWSPAPSLSLVHSPATSAPASRLPAPDSVACACLTEPASVIAPLPIIATDSRSPTT